MLSLEEFRRCGEDLENILLLKSSPIAVKMLEKEADIPKGAVRPFRDRGYHLAQCQAFALSRRRGETIAMLKEDHWCPAAMIVYGMAPGPKNPVPTAPRYDCFELGKYVGIVTAPLKSTSFKPDVVIIYSNTAQLRSLLLAQEHEKPPIEGRFFPPSCGYAVVNVVQTGRCFVVLPDPGEYQRALTGEDEIMFAVPADKLSGIVENLKRSQDHEFAYRKFDRLLQPDFPRPDFYKKIFREWGLDDS
jgi:uncharacterized protein (DUF169 family)